MKVISNSGSWIRWASSKPVTEKVTRQGDTRGGAPTGAHRRETPGSPHLREGVAVGPLLSVIPTAASRWGSDYRGTRKRQLPRTRQGVYERECLSPICASKSEMNKEMKLKVHKVSLKEAYLLLVSHFLTPTPDQSWHLPCPVISVHFTACKFVFLLLIIIHISVIIKLSPPENCLVIQWLELCTSTGMGYRFDPWSGN